jgi:hypothetical protein
MPKPGFATIVNDEAILAIATFFIDIIKLANYIFVILIKTSELAVITIRILNYCKLKITIIIEIYSQDLFIAMTLNFEVVNSN